MLELLLAAGVFDAAATNGSTWSIQPPGVRIPLEAVKISAPDILLAGIDPPPAALSQLLEFKPESPPAPVFPQKSEPVKIGTQLSLIPLLEPVTDGGARPPPVQEILKPSSSDPVSASPSARFGLQAPMRLTQVVRDVLADAIRTLNDDLGPATVCTIAQGMFVPLAEFSRRDVQPSLVIRALMEANMLVKTSSDGSPTLSREFNGQSTIGIVLDPRYVSGLDLTGFDAPPAEEN